MLVNLEDLKKPGEQRAELKKSIYRAKKQIEKQAENLKELFELIKKRPDLPIVAMVDSEIVADDGGFWLGEWGRCEVDKYIVNENYGVIFYEQGRPDTVDIFEKYFDYAECGIDEELPDEQALPLMKEKIDTLNWTEAIIVYIVLPDYEEVQHEK